MWGAILSVASRVTGKLGPGATRCGVAILVGLFVGVWVAMKFFTPEPETRIEYITEVIEQQAPQTEVVVEEAERQVEIKYVEKIIEKEVLKYVPVESDPVACNVPIGSVRLLNDARDGRLREDSVPSTTAAYDGEGSTPSTITRRDLIRDNARLAIQYNKVATRYNALIEWLEIQQASLSVD